MLPQTFFFFIYIDFFFPFSYLPYNNFLLVFSSCPAFSSFILLFFFLHLFSVPSPILHLFIIQLYAIVHHHSLFFLSTFICFFFFIFILHPCNTFNIIFLRFIIVNLLFIFTFTSSIVAKVIHTHTHTHTHTVLPAVTPGGLVVRTLASQARGRGLDPRAG